MSSTSNTTTLKVALSLVLVLNTARLCEAASAMGITGVAVTATASQTSVRSPDDMCDMASFIFAGSEVLRPSSSVAAVATDEKHTTAPALADVSPEVTEESSWQDKFAAGVYESKRAVEFNDKNCGSWVTDPSAGAAVPARMLRAEIFLQAVEKASESEGWKAKTAERALRVYYHAKWLAEHNYARAAEHRYREAAHLARTCRRTVLASHALARLGYFLVQWKRQAEAVTVLEESMKLNIKSNPLAPYLHGVLERKVAGGDVERLREAEAFIMSAGEQPSEELEAERTKLVDEISYWREAEGDSRHCAAGSDAAYVLICFFGHAVAFLKGAFFK